MKLKRVGEIIEDGLLERQAIGDIQDFYINLDHDTQKVDVIVLPKMSMNSIIMDVKLGKDV